LRIQFKRDGLPRRETEREAEGWAWASAMVNEVSYCNNQIAILIPYYLYLFFWTRDDETWPFISLTHHSIRGFFIVILHVTRKISFIVTTILEKTIISVSHMLDDTVNFTNLLEKIEKIWYFENIHQDESNNTLYDIIYLYISKRILSNMLDQ